MPTESVWDYPRPPALERTSRLLEVRHGGQLIARTTRGWRVLETSHPPTYYFPRADVMTEYLRPRAGASRCEWKGQAEYFDVVVGDHVADAAAFAYPSPTGAFADLADAVAFYASRLDEALVDGVQVQPQAGGFYAGWITSDLRGPFKGGPGTMGW
jgi:uncharacterized protein (DUF427 family)